MSQVDESPYEYRKRTNWLRFLAIVGIVLLVLVVGAVVLALVLAPRIVEQGSIASSQNNVRNLSMLLSEHSLRRDWPRYGGKAFVLSVVASGQLDVSRGSNAEVLFSPADTSRRPEDVSRARWSEVTTAALRSGRGFNDLTSYAGRRNDESDLRITPALLRDGVPIIADVHFEDVAIVGFTDGSARVMDRTDLGLGSDDPIIVGPDSRSPILRQLSDE